MPNRCRCFFMLFVFLIGEYCCCCCCCCCRGLVAFVCRGLTVDDRLTLQRYSASHGVVNVFSVCCTNLRGLCANHHFCGGQSRRLVQGRACTSYMCPLRASRILLLKVRVRASAVAVASARTRHLHSCVSRLFVVFYVKGVEFFEKCERRMSCFITFAKFIRIAVVVINIGSRDVYFC